MLFGDIRQGAGELVERLKGRYQDGQAALECWRCRRQANRLGLKIVERDGLEEELRKRFAERGLSVRAKAKGELHLFLCFYDHGSWETILPESLSPFGRVTVFNGVERERNDAALLEAFAQAQRKQPVDAMIGYLSGCNVRADTLRQIERAGVVVYNFCWDDKLNWPGKSLNGRYHSTAGIASAVDLNLTNAPSSLIKYAAFGGLALFWPEAAHPRVHCPVASAFDFDVSFVGARYGWRPAFIRRLADLGIKVECFGRGWPNGPLSASEMIRLYSRSRINLGFAGVGYSRRLMCLKGRDFEVPMSGGLYLTQDNPELQLVYNVGREVLTHRNEKDCARVIRSLLAEPERAAAIRSAGRNRALRDHTYEARWADIFSLAGLMKKSQDTHNGSIGLDFETRISSDA